MFVVTQIVSQVNRDPKPVCSNSKTHVCSTEPCLQVTSKVSTGILKCACPAYPFLPRGCHKPTEAACGPSLCTFSGAYKQHSCTNFTFTSNAPQMVSCGTEAGSGQSGHCQPRHSLGPTHLALNRRTSHSHLEDFPEVEAGSCLVWGASGLVLSLKSDQVLVSLRHLEHLGRNSTPG